MHSTFPAQVITNVDTRFFTNRYLIELTDPRPYGIGMLRRQFVLPETYGIGDFPRIVTDECQKLAGERTGPNLIAARNIVIRDRGDRYLSRPPPTYVLSLNAR